MAATKGKTTTAVNLRAGAGTQFPSLAILPAGTPVEVIRDTGAWLRVEVAGRKGFIHESYIALDSAASPADPLPDVPMAPPESERIRLGPRPTSCETSVAHSWNTAGNLLSTLATRLKFDAGSAVAIFSTESCGKGFENGRLLVRFENHHFFKHWGEQNRARYDAHFQFDDRKPWTGHVWRASASGSFEKVHQDQSSEWRCFEFACSLDLEAARKSISMGGPQILGSNFVDAGFESVGEMFDAFCASEKRQIVAFFDFLQRVDANPVLALQKGDFRRFAEIYNGKGNADEYSSRLKTALQTYQRLRPSAASTTAT